MRLKTRIPRGRYLSAGAGLAALAFLSAGCSGSVGASGGGEAEGEGYDYGASPEEIRSAFSDVDPVTLVYQPSALSENDPTARRAQDFKAAVEDLSGGKISIDVVYAQAIASYEEVPDALVDGRVDIANLPIVYFPREFPAFNALVGATTQLEVTPFVGELAATAAMTELWWNTSAVLDEFEAASIHPILPIEPTGQQAAVCKDEFTDAEQWNGALVRGSSAAHVAQIEGAGASPVSMTFGEVFEALQRNTIECTMSPLIAVPMTGLADVAPNINYPTQVGIARGPSVIGGGAKFDSLPLVAQQLIFDQGAGMYANSRYADFEGVAETAKSVREAGGGFHEMSDELQDELQSASEEMIQESVDDGVIDAAAVSDLQTAYDKWLAAAEEHGYTDDGAYGEFDEWYSEDTVDLAPFSAQLFDDVFLPHRPGAE